MGIHMHKKSLAIAVLSLATLAVGTLDAWAWGWKHHKYTTQITCRPYNAFTPICWGNLVCDGCCPNPCGVAGGCLPCGMGMGMGMYGFGMGGHGFGMGSFGCPTTGCEMPIEGSARSTMVMPNVAYYAPMATPYGAYANYGYANYGIQQANYYQPTMPYMPQATYARPYGYGYAAYPYGYGY